MKYTLSVFLVLLLTMISGCSKPEPPAAKAPLTIKKPAVKKHILAVPAVTSEEHYVETEPQAMAPVSVTDADNGLPITHATVVLHWYSEEGQKVCFGIHTVDGVYQVATNAIRSRYYVGAHADGYLPEDTVKPTFPVEIALKKGDTIKVFGAIHYANGYPVTNGIVKLIPLDHSLWEKNWRQLSPCSIIPDSNGEFIMPHVPVGDYELYVAYELPDNTRLPFKAQPFSTANGDVHLSLQLPPELNINGRVLLSSGSAVSGAWVWTELVKGDAPDTFNMKLANTYEAVSGITTKTDENGCFELNLHKIVNRYVIKAYHPFYTPTYSGPYSDAVRPQEPVELIIQEEGAHLYGRLSDTAGKPVTNCVMQYCVMGDEGYGKNNKVYLDIKEDGNFLSGIVPPGVHSFTCIAPGYNRKKKKVIIRKNAAELCDIQFMPFITVTGTVYDAVTLQPIPGVTLIDNSRKNQLFSKTTDQNGQFWVRDSDSQLCIDFHHPDYAPLTYNICKYDYYTAGENYTKIHQVKVFLSGKGCIRVRGEDTDGNALDGYIVKMMAVHPNNQPKSPSPIYSTYQQADLIEGEALLTNIPASLSPVYVELYSNIYGYVLAKSELVHITEGQESFVLLSLPEKGNLVINFSNPIRNKAVCVGVNRIEESTRGTHHISVLSKFLSAPEEQYIALSNQITGNYHIEISGIFLNTFNTNVLVSAKQTTEVLINNDTTLTGTICGTVADYDETLMCYVYARKHPPGYQSESSLLHRRNSFTFSGLSPDCLYDLTLSVDIGSVTNISVKNIAPNGPPVTIQFPDAYRITGNVIDAGGNPLKAQIGTTMLRNYGPGEFTLYPAFQGTHTVRIVVPGYPMAFHKVSVHESNVDMGDIVMSDKGISLSGRIVTKENEPVGPIDFYVLSKSDYSLCSTSTDSNGYFKAETLPRDMPLTISSRHGKWKFKHETQPLSSDTDIGDIVINRAY